MHSKYQPLQGALMLLFILVLAACQASPSPTAGPTTSSPGATQVAPTVSDGTEPAVVPSVVPTAGTVATQVQGGTGSGAVPNTGQGKTLRANLPPAGDIPTIDPSLATDMKSIQVVDMFGVGLTRTNEATAQTVPGVATDWDISEDGRTYTFHLRDDVPWVAWDADQNQVVKVQDCAGNDRMVTAQDFEYGILRTLNPATASGYAYVLGFVVEGANAFNASEVTDPETVGVQAVDEQTITITFMEPASFNHSIAGLWVAHAQPRWLIEGDECTEAQGEAWAEAGVIQSYGPFVVAEWNHDSDMTMVKNPFWPGTESVPQPKIDRIEFTFLDDPAALAEFEAGNLDVVLVPSADLDRLKADSAFAGQIKTVPQLCALGYSFNTQAAVVDDVRVRQALSLAIDRETIAKNIFNNVSEPAQWFARPGLAGAPTMQDYPDLGAKYDPERAKEILDGYLQETGTTADQLDITLVEVNDPIAQRTAEALQQMWQDTLGIQVELVFQEWDSFLQSIVDPQATPQIYGVGWCKDYPDANNFTRDVFAQGGSNNPGKGGVNWVNETFEDLVARAAVETDVVQRTKLYSQAEQILVWEDAVYLPLVWSTFNELTRSNVTRTFSVDSVQHYEKWDIAP